MNKYFVIGIILLFLGISISPAITAVDTDIYKINDESIENPNVINPPQGTEIFTRIWVATANFGELIYEETGEGFFRHVEIWIDSGSISFWGFMREFPWFFNRENYDIRHLVLPRCHITYVDRWPYELYLLGAFAIGDIYK